MSNPHGNPLLLSCLFCLVLCFPTRGHLQASEEIEQICMTYARVTQVVMPPSAVEISHVEPTQHHPFSIQLRVPSVLDDRVIDSAMIEIGKPVKYRFELHPFPLLPDETMFRIHLPERELKRSTIWFRYDGAGRCRGATGLFFDYAYPLTNEDHKNEDSLLPH